MSNWAKVILILCFEITSVFGLNQFAAAMEKERNMRAEDLPAGTGGAPLAYPHFPTRWQAVVWRNWELVSPARLAAVLGCSEAEIVQAASEMGLTVEPKVNPKWITHGYLTLIRNNWQLLPYSQMLELLGWTPEKMAFTLKEEDFFWVKVGKVKPDCPPVKYQALDPVQRQATEQLRITLHRYFPPERQGYQEAPFAFADKFAPQRPTGGADRFDFNYIHSYAASCGDVQGNADQLDPVPENLLAQYASMGIRGVWMHALLYLLTPIPGAEEFSVGAEKRVENLKKIVERCAKHGIKVYLYLNEPRCMPLGFYKKKPHWGGLDVPNHQTKTICTTGSKEPLEWLENSLKELFSRVPGLGGAFCITMSENPTNCHYRFKHKDCPSCRKVLPEKIVADIVAAMERGMHAADPQAKMIVFDWAWKRFPGSRDNAAFKHAVIDLLPQNVYICSVSEWGMITRLGGVEQYLTDYSISQVGPSLESLDTWQYARKKGIKVTAKVQINNSWELSAVPYVPVPYLINEHLTRLKKAGVSGLMLSWTLGGFPGGNLDLLTASPEEIAASKFHPELAGKVCRIWKQFSESYRQFPFNVQVLYNAPMNYGPMNLLHLKPSGRSATMIGFPYDDLRVWRGPYPEEIFEHQFRLVAEGWKKGLDLLAEAESEVREQERADFRELKTIAEAAYCHLRSTWLQIRFIMARDRSEGPDLDVMRACAREEIEMAVKLHEIVRRDSRIGFEASNHYYYSLNDLREKVVSCDAILKELK